MENKEIRVILFTQTFCQMGTLVGQTVYRTECKNIDLRQKSRLNYVYAMPMCLPLLRVVEPLLERDGLSSPNKLTAMYTYHP